MTTLFPIGWWYDLLKLIEIPIAARIFIIGISIVNFAVSWFAERYLFPKIAVLIGHLIDFSLYTSKQEAEDEETVRSVSLVKIRKWDKNGKRYKILQELYKNR